jgi:hypothetical protein
MIVGKGREWSIGQDKGYVLYVGGVDHVDHTSNKMTQSLGSGSVEAIMEPDPHVRDEVNLDF